MKAELFREQKDEALWWHHVGPGHERACFNLINIVGYAAAKHTNEHPYFEAPFHIYTMAGGEALTEYKTIPAAKRAALIIAKLWIESAETSSIVWHAHDSGEHFNAKVAGIPIANYYYSRKPVGDYDKDFRVWFGGTFYLTKFESPDQAREAVAETWKTWLETAQVKLLKKTDATIPRRIQLSRKKGFKLPPNTVVVSRPSKWGNPFKVDEFGRDGAIKQFRYLVEKYNLKPQIKAELRGKNLACWCPLNQPCHADVLLELAN
jgi:hypothetical protein